MTKGKYIPLRSYMNKVNNLVSIKKYHRLIEIESNECVDIFNLNYTLKYSTNPKSLGYLIHKYTPIYWDSMERYKNKIHNITYKYFIQNIPTIEV